MINIILYISKSLETLGFNILGHSGYSGYGSDIVCAAVSSAAYMTVNTLTDIIGIKADVFVDKNGEMNVLIDSKYYSDCKAVLEGFKIHVFSLAKMYPKNINIKCTEV